MTYPSLPLPTSPPITSLKHTLPIRPPTRSPLHRHRIPLRIVPTKVSSHLSHPLSSKTQDNTHSLTSAPHGSPFPPSPGPVLVPGPPLLSQSSQLPLYSPTRSYPACFASCAAALLLTPALQKNTISLSSGGFWKPKRSWKSSSERRRASGWEETGRLRARGMELVENSEGSRTSIRRVVERGDSTMERTWGEVSLG